MMTPSTSWRRTPGVRVSFLNEQVLALPSDQLVAVTTQKTLQDPAGHFSLVLRAGRQGPKDTRVGAATGELSYWMSVLRPMTLVQIIMGEGDLGDGGFVAPDGQRETLVGMDRANKLPAQDRPLHEDDAQITMLGVIDRVELVKRMGPQGPERVVEVTGRDMGRCFIDDQHYAFAFPYVTPTTTEQSALAHYIFRDREHTLTPDQINAFTARYFLRRAGDAAPEAQQETAPDGTTTPKKEATWQQVFLTGTVGDILRAIHENASALDTLLLNGHSLREYLPKVDVAPDVDPIPFWGQKLFLSSGSVWSMFDHVVPRPFGEVFIDTVGRQARLIVRRPPWGRPWPDQREQIDALGDLVSGRDPNPTETPISAELEGSPDRDLQDDGDLRGTAQYFYTRDLLWTTDEVTTTGTRLDPTKPYHEVNDADLVELRMGRSDREACNFFFTKASSNWMASDSGLLQSAALVPPILDINAATRYGIRMLQRENSWWNPQVSAKNIDLRVELILDNLRLYYWFRDNPDYLAGQATLRGNSAIRIGDYVYFPEYDVIGYVEGVVNTFQYGRPYLTTIQFTRGQPKALPTETKSRSTFMITQPAASSASPKR